MPGKSGKGYGGSGGSTFLQRDSPSPPPWRLLPESLSSRFFEIRNPPRAPGLTACLLKVKILAIKEPVWQCQSDDMNPLDQLSRRERQIMQVIYSKGEATATEVLDSLPDPPTRTSVRTFLQILERKGYLKHKKRSREFVYSPVQQRQRAGQSAFKRLIETFFEGSLEKAVASHLSDPRVAVPPGEMQRLAALIKQARNKKE